MDSHSNSKAPAIMLGLAIFVLLGVGTALGCWLHGYSYLDNDNLSAPLLGVENVSVTTSTVSVTPAPGSEAAYYKMQLDSYIAAGRENTETEKLSPLQCREKSNLQDKNKRLIIGHGLNDVTRENSTVSDWDVRLECEPKYGKYQIGLYQTSTDTFFPFEANLGMYYDYTNYEIIGFLESEENYPVVFVNEFGYRSSLGYKIVDINNLSQINISTNLNADEKLYRATVLNVDRATVLGSTIVMDGLSEIITYNYFTGKLDSPVVLADGESLGFWSGYPSYVSSLEKVDDNTVRYRVYSHGFDYSNDSNGDGVANDEDHGPYREFTLTD